LKILHVTSSMDPRGGGVAEAIRQLAPALLRAGHANEVATVDDPSADYLQGLPFPVHALGPSRSSYQRAPGIEPWLREHAGGFDCVISHGLWQHQGLAAWRACRATGTARFVFPHGMLDPWFKRAYPRKHLKKWVYWLLAEYHILRSARAVFFTCAEEQRLARESFWLYSATEAIAPLGIADPPADAEAQREAFLSAYPELRGQRFVLFLGRVHPKKGCDLLLEAWARSGTGLANERLVIAGPGDPVYMNLLRESAAHWPQPPLWTGMLTGSVKWGALRAADAFILPSHQENFGLATVEALACGCPVLLSDKVNIWREIEEDGAGLIAADTAEGAGCLLAQWRDWTPAARAGYATNARASFASRFQIDRAAAGLVSQLRAFGVAN
jgi:glycosyltransferase involved in cell wall biosynthesis